MTKDTIEEIARSRVKKSEFPDPRSEDMGVTTIEERFNCRLPKGFSEMRELIGIYCISGDHLPESDVLLTYEWELKHNPNWSEDFIPFYAIGNGNYLCFRRSENKESGIYYVAHDDPKVQKLHRSFEDYIRDPEWFN